MLLKYLHDKVNSTVSLCFLVGELLNCVDYGCVGLHVVGSVCAQNQGRIYMCVSCKVSSNMVQSLKTVLHGRNMPGF
jgi:hypothetical protein